MEAEICFTGNMKTSSRTPDHLRTHKLSLLDQTFGPLYVSQVHFCLNNQNINTTDVTSNRLNNLKLSLSDTLSRFYPFAGRIKDDLYIDCNDERVYYVEAKIQYRLSEHLMQPDDRLIRQLLPQHHDVAGDISSSGSYVLLRQMNRDGKNINYTSMNSQSI